MLLVANIDTVENFKIKNHYTELLAIAISLCNISPARLMHAFNGENKLSNLCDDLRSGDDDPYKKAKKLLHDNTIGQLRCIVEACMEPKLLASMTGHRSAIEKVYEADDEEWPDGPEFDRLSMAETEALDALVDTPVGSLEALLQKDMYLRLMGG